MSIRIVFQCIDADGIVYIKGFNTQGILIEFSYNPKLEGIV
jgi:hypothetical protein